MAYAGTQTYNSTRSAADLAFSGYAVQSLAISRLAAEYFVLFLYIRSHPERAEGGTTSARSRRSG